MDYLLTIIDHFLIPPSSLINHILQTKPESPVKYRKYKYPL